MYFSGTPDPEEESGKRIGVGLTAGQLEPHDSQQESQQESYVDKFTV